MQNIGLHLRCSETEQLGPTQEAQAHSRFKSEENDAIIRLRMHQNLQREALSEGSLKTLLHCPELVLDNKLRCSPAKKLESTC